MDANNPAIDSNWWNHLPADIHQRPWGTSLDRKHPLRVGATAAMDHVTASLLSSMVCGALAPTVLRSAQPEQAALAVHKQLADNRDFDQVFRAAEGMPAIQQTLLDPGSGKWPIRRERLRFDSPYVPAAASIAEHYQSFSRNNRADAEYWTHADGPRPTLIFVHGYLFSAPAVYKRMFHLPWFYRNGYDILLFRQPFHGSRRGMIDPWSGYGMFAHGLAMFNEAMLQGVQELRLLVDWLLTRGAPNVGISGISLGGYMSAIMAAVEPRLAFAIPNSPLVSPLDTALSWRPSRWAFPLMAKRYQMNMNEIRHAMALHSPLSWPLQLDAHRTLIIGGAGDRITPPRYVRMLHEHWPGTHLHWFPGNHVVHLQQGYYLKMMKWFMDRHSGLG